MSRPKRKWLEYLGISLDEYQEWLGDTHGLTVGSLDMSWEEPGSEMINQISDTEQHWPSRLFEKAELNRLLVRAVDRLPYAERTVLSLYYLEELTLREIASVMEIHESRVSQLKSQGVLRLRAHLDRCWPTPRSGDGDLHKRKRPKPNARAARIESQGGQSTYVSASRDTCQRRIFDGQLKCEFAFVANDLNGKRFFGAVRPNGSGDLARAADAGVVNFDDHVAGSQA